MRLIKSTSTQEEPSGEARQSCQHCQVGQMQRRAVALFTWMGNEQITVPDFPARVCDVCGFRQYDTRALRRLNLLLASQSNSSFVKRPGSRWRTSGEHPLPPTHES